VAEKLCSKIVKREAIILKKVTLLLLENFNFIDSFGVQLRSFTRKRNSKARYSKICGLPQISQANYTPK
jgi:hypothetical protein